MRIRFLEIAEIELHTAIDYYNYEFAGLGDAFLAEVLNTLDRIGRHPNAWQVSQDVLEGVRPGVSLMALYIKCGKTKF